MRAKIRGDQWRREGQIKRNLVMVGRRWRTGVTSTAAATSTNQKPNDEQSMGEAPSDPIVETPLLSTGGPHGNERREDKSNNNYPYLHQKEKRREKLFRAAQALLRHNPAQKIKWFL